MKKLLFKIIAVLLLLLIVGLVAVVFFLGNIIKKGVETAGPAITKVDVRLDQASVSIIGGSAQLKGLFVGNPKEYKTDFAIKVGSVSVVLKPMSVLGEKVIVESVNVQAPEIILEGGLKENNLTRILDNINGASGSSSEPAKTSEPAQKSQSQAAGKKLQVSDLLISGAKVHANTMLSNGKTVTLTIPDFHISNLGAGPDGITATELSKVVLNELINRIIPAVKEEATRLGKDVLESKNVDEAKKKVTEGLKGFLKK
jgi:hypothetical protein